MADVKEDEPLKPDMTVIEAELKIQRQWPGGRLIGREKKGRQLRARYAPLDENNATGKKMIRRFCGHGRSGLKACFIHPSDSGGCVVRVVDVPR
jgi:hypothetical protein